MENNNDERDLNENPKMNSPENGDIEKQNEWHDHAETDKYISLEQPGVTYTDEGNPTMNPDDLGDENEQLEYQTYDPAGGNSRNSDAFVQDDYILTDNIDLDEDQNQSISFEDNDR